MNTAVRQMSDGSDGALSVKELAAALGRSTGFVYKMRMAGFEMFMGQSTRAEAVEWIRRTGFRVVHGLPVTSTAD